MEASVHSLVDDEECLLSVLPLERERSSQDHGHLRLEQLWVSGMLATDASRGRAMPPPISVQWALGGDTGAGLSHDLARVRWYPRDRKSVV